jgi:hypothetical protein
LGRTGTGLSFVAKKPDFSGFSPLGVEKAPISCAFLTFAPFILREMP